MHYADTFYSGICRAYYILILHQDLLAWNRRLSRSTNQTLRAGESEQQCRLKKDVEKYCWDLVFLPNLPFLCRWIDGKLCCQHWDTSNKVMLSILCSFILLLQMMSPSLLVLLLPAGRNFFWKNKALVFVTHMNSASEESSQSSICWTVSLYYDMKTVL